MRVAKFYQDTNDIHLYIIIDNKCITEALFF